MIRDHKFYEMQSALAATGQLTNAELTELEQHATDCASCHEYIVDMAEMSRQFFVVQAGRKNSKGAPAGMQERFLERAASAGLPVSRSTFTLFDPRFARVAAIAVLLAISLSLSWKVSSVPNMERAGASDSSTSETQPAPTLGATPPIVEEQAARAVSISKAFRRRSAARRRAATMSSAHGAVEDRQAYLEPSMPLFANQESPTSFSDGIALWSDELTAGHLTAEMHIPTRPSFTNTWAASFFGGEGKEDSKLEDPAFRLDLKLASLSFVDFPQSINPQSPITSLKFSNPVFHLDPNRGW